MCQRSGGLCVEWGNRGSCRGSRLRGGERIRCGGRGNVNNVRCGRCSVMASREGDRKLPLRSGRCCSGGGSSSSSSSSFRRCLLPGPVQRTALRLTSAGVRQCRRR